ncbi:hypothetical protein EON65_10445 [archaeon]|nr:MAG: hypothetical protein EON65_10445 [archaeon]
MLLSIILDLATTQRIQNAKSVRKTQSKMCTLSFAMSCCIHSSYMSSSMRLNRLLFIVFDLIPLSSPWQLSGGLFSKQRFILADSKAELVHAVKAETGIKQLQVLFNCDQIDPDEFSEFMFEMGCLSVSAEVITEKQEVLNDEKRWADLVKTRCWSTALLRANVQNSFDSENLISILRETYPHFLFDIKLETVALQDWVMEVQKGWRPQVIGDLTIRFPWHVEEKVTTSHVLTLAGGAAFGTGDHPTTRLCCEWLSTQVMPGDSILDYGCGSAVLALGKICMFISLNNLIFFSPIVIAAALRYGAGSAEGTDIDKDSLYNARQNALDNELTVGLYLASDEDLEDRSSDQIDQINFKDESISILTNQLRGHGKSDSDLVFESVDRIVGKQYDLVVANILAPVLISLAPAISGHVKDGGKLALSGVVNKQAEIVVRAYQKYFQEVVVESIEEDWVLIIAKKAKQNNIM